MFIIHCANAVIAMIKIPSFASDKIPAKSTLPFARIKSIAFPVRIGKYKVSATVMVARIIDKIKIGM